MALTDNRTQLQDCEDVSDVGTASNADPQSDTTEAGFVIEGATATQFQVTNAQEFVVYDKDTTGTTFSLDLSDSTVYTNVKDNLQDTFANLGVQIVISDGTDDIGYVVAGVDVLGLPYEKKYSAYKLDVSVIVASPGTDNVDFYTHNGTEANNDQTVVSEVGYGSIHLAKGQGTIPNAWFDGIYYIANDSYAATITGGTSGTPETMADLIGDDVTAGAAMFNNPKASEYGIFAPTEWGDSGTGTSAFSGTDEQWYYYGDNGGGHAVGATHFPMRLVGNATGTNIFRQTRVTNINTGTRAQFDMSHANFDEIELDTTTWVDFGAITFPTQDASKFCNSSTFINCDQAYLSSLDMDSCTFIGTTDALGAILWDASVTEENQDNLSFISDGTGHAIEISLNTATLTTFNIDGYSVSGYETADDTATGNTVFLVDNALDGNVTINVTNGTGTFSYERAAGYTGTVSVVQSVNVEFEAVDKDDAAIQSVLVTAYLISDDSEVINTTTNASGIASTTFSGGTPADGYYRYRKNSSGAQKYENLSGFFTISSTGSVVKRSMVEDDISDPSA